MRLIDADKAKAAIKEICDKYSISYGGCGGFGESIAKVIDLQPVIGVEPVRHGRWITSEMTIDTGCTSCSCCRSEYYIGDLQALEDDDDFVMFCPHCGAKMDLEDNP